MTLLNRCTDSLQILCDCSLDRPPPSLLELVCYSYYGIMGNFVQFVFANSYISFSLKPLTRSHSHVIV